MKHEITSFRGEVPLLASHSLPATAASAAINARLFTGDLTNFKQFGTTKQLGRFVKTISLMAGEFWLSFVDQVDVARGIIPGDKTYRTYLTGLDAPRFTNLALATTGAEPYPVATRLLGVPPPDAPPTYVIGVDTTPTTFSIDVFDEGDQFTTHWTASGDVSILGGTTNSFVRQDAAVGHPAPSYAIHFDENHNPGEEGYLYRNFGVAGSAVLHMTMDFAIGGDYGRSANMLAGVTLQGSGVGVSYINGFLQIRKYSQWGGQFYNATIASLGLGTAISLGDWATMKVDVIANADGTKTVTAGIYLGSAQIGTVVATNTFDDGDYCGMSAGLADDAPTEFITYFDNILVQASGSLGVVFTEIATSYVYTFVNDLGEESAPSLPSATLVRPDGVTVTVTSPTHVPSGIEVSDYGIVTKRIYRAATGNSGSAFRFVAEIPLSQADYVDTLTDTQLGEVLDSDDWALPPADLRGIIALPNGVMAGFSGNQLCLSAQNQPHAWPVGNRYTTDTDIVGIGNIDTTVVIGTGSFVYVASGNDPANYSMSKFEVPHAASSKLSFAYITGMGVVFAGPDGLMVCGGIGQLRNLTETIFTRRQWQALGPDTIFSVAHNDIYFMFYGTSSHGGCYAVDLRSNGFGIVEMAFHANCAYVDPVDDRFYMVLDSDTDPELPAGYPTPSIPDNIDQTTIFEFEGASEFDPSVMHFDWTSKLWLEPFDMFYTYARVRADNYGALCFRIYGDGELLDEIRVEDDEVFTLTPPDSAYRTFQLQILGKGIVQAIGVATDATELGGLSQAQTYQGDG